MYNNAINLDPKTHLCAVFLSLFWLALGRTVGSAAKLKNRKQKRLVIRLIEEPTQPAIVGVCTRCRSTSPVLMASTSQGYIPLCIGCLSVARTAAKGPQPEPARKGGRRSSQDAMFKRLPGSLSN